ncbi:hypothetical protein [Acinetobacter baumannii]|uniref:hypothetical protein n=1 Tax=Acinetobacter baumannii TaxID=470 RepID=UPI00367135E9
MGKNGERVGMGLSFGSSLEENYIERIRKRRDKLKSLNDSVAASQEYMRWRGDVYEKAEPKAISDLYEKVSEQSKTISATANAITQLNTSIGGNVAPVSHSNRYKAILADKPYVMYLQGCKYVVNPDSMPYHDLRHLDPMGIVSVLKIFDRWTNIKIHDYASIQPIQLEVLDKTIFVWDKRADVDKFEIFKQVMEFSDDDFDTYARKRGWRVHRDPYNKLLTLSKPDPVHIGFPRKSRMIMPEEICEWEDETEEDFDECWEFENERSRIDRTPPSLKKGKDVDTSMAEAMKARRDGRFDVRVMSDGTTVKVGEPKLSMSEEIEQRLIEKYLT